MLASAETIKIVAETLRYWQDRTGKELQIVLDPVMVATSGAQLLEPSAVHNLRTLILPMTTVLTPNIPEAALLLRDANIKCDSPTTLNDLKSLAKQLHSLGPKHVLLKGGHMPLTKSYTKATTDAEKYVTVDILYPSRPNATVEEAFMIIEQPYLDIKNTHGTGCTLASALAANLAHASFLPAHSRPPLSDNARKAISFVTHGISSSTSLQSTLHNTGPGPINHFHSLLTSAFPLGHFIPYLLSHPKIAPVWERYISHPFATAMGNGTLPLSTFKKYLIQDYLYLTHFARTYALAAYKSTNITQISRCAEIVLHIQTEMNLHLSYCAEFGISKEEIEATPESLVCTAYSRYVLDVGNSGDVLGLYVALAPCLIGYGIVAERLSKQLGLDLDTNDERHGHDGETGEMETMTAQQEGGKVHERVAAQGHAQNERSKRGNPYIKWIQNYISPDYIEAVTKGRATIEDEIIRQGGLGRERVEELVEIFRRATEMEVGFWEVDGHGSNHGAKA